MALQCAPNSDKVQGEFSSSGGKREFFGGGTLLSGGGSLMRSDLDHSNLFQS